MRLFLVFSLLGCLLTGCATDSSCDSTRRTFPGPAVEYFLIAVAEEAVENSRKAEKDQSRIEKFAKLIPEMKKRLMEASLSLCVDGGIHETCRKVSFVVNEEGPANAYPWGTHKASINKDILAYVENEHQLAFLMAHQIGHQFAEHVKERAVISHGEKVGAASIFAFLLCGQHCMPNIINANSSSPNVEYEEDWDISFSGFEEREANYLAIYILDAADYDVREARRFLLKMAALGDKAGTDDRDKALYLDTHQFAGAHIARIDAAIREIAEKKRKGERVLPTFRLPKPKSDFE